MMITGQGRRVLQYSTELEQYSRGISPCHEVMNALMALLIGLKYATGMENLITLLVVALVFYFALMSFA